MERAICLPARIHQAAFGEAQVQAVQVKVQAFAVHGRDGYQGGSAVPMTSSLCKIAPGSPPGA